MGVSEFLKKFLEGRDRAAEELSVLLTSLKRNNSI